VFHCTRLTWRNGNNHGIKNNLSYVQDLLNLYIIHVVTITYTTSETISDSAEWNYTDSSGMAVLQVLYPCSVHLQLAFTLVVARAFLLSSVYVSWLYFHSRSKNYLHLLFVTTVFKFYSGVLSWFSFILNSVLHLSSKHDNLAFHANFVTWYFGFHHNGM